MRLIARACYGVGTSVGVSEGGGSVVAVGGSVLVGGGCVVLVGGGWVVAVATVGVTLPAFAVAVRLSQACVCSALNVPVAAKFGVRVNVGEGVIDGVKVAVGVGVLVGGKNWVGVGGRVTVGPPGV